MESSRFQTKQRLIAILCVSTFIFALLFARLFYLQVISGFKLTTKAVDQWTRDLPITPTRGNILDRNGEVLASSETSYGIYARAKNIGDAGEVASALAPLLDLQFDALFVKLSNRGVSEVTLARQVDSETTAIIRNYNFHGIYIATETSRVYPYSDYMAQVLGFVSIDNVGQMGIEAYYDKYLRGVDGQILTPSDLIGIELDNTEVTYLPGIDGLDVVLTIDWKLQSVTENVLKLIMKTHQPKRAGILVMDVTTGEILAMGANPSVDLNDLPRNDIEALMAGSKNFMLTDVYEPGSTFKVLTTAMMLEEAAKGNKNSFDVNHVFRNNANYRLIDGSKISCWTNHNNGKHHNQTISEALNHSCNPIFTDIALAMGKKTTYDYLEKFGYGSLSGIDFAGEQSGIVLAESIVKNADLARIGFGQTIAVTALQLANATAAAVNGGYLMKPYLVKEIRKDGKAVVKYTPTVKNRTISAASSQQLALLLEGVVTNGSGKQTYIEGYHVGGKTGTAQKFENGKIAEGKYVSSFVGFFPATSPKYLALVMVDEPVGQSYGSTVAAPFAKILFQHLIYHNDLKPS